MKKAKFVFFLMLTLISVASLILSALSFSALSKARVECENIQYVCGELQEKLYGVKKDLGDLSKTADSIEVLLDRQNDSQASAQVSVYVVREHNGIIGVFDKNGALVRSVNTAVVSLSENDIAKLNEGIIVCSEEELSRLLEDLS